MYFNLNGIEDIACEFRKDSSAYGVPDPDILKDLENAEVLFASYSNVSYEGEAIIIYSKNGVLYEVHGSHCSCNGLEGQWSPEETTYEAIFMRYKDEHDVERLKTCHGESACANLLRVLLNYEVEKNLLK